LLAGPGHAYNLFAPGEISTGEVGIFQPAKTGEFSTGVDMNMEFSHGKTEAMAILPAV
jgi:hypothetical protein